MRFFNPLAAFSVVALASGAHAQEAIDDATWEQETRRLAQICETSSEACLAATERYMALAIGDRDPASLTPLDQAAVNTRALVAWQAVYNGIQSNEAFSAPEAPESAALDGVIDSEAQEALNTQAMAEVGDRFATVLDFVGTFIDPESVPAEGLETMADVEEDLRSGEFSLEDAADFTEGAEVLAALASPS